MDINQKRAKLMEIANEYIESGDIFSVTLGREVLSHINDDEEEEYPGEQVDSILNGLNFLIDEIERLKYRIYRELEMDRRFRNAL